MSWNHACARLLERPAERAPRIALVVAHPDDEVIGAGGTLLPGLPDAHVVHVTDGAPADMRDAHALGFRTREAYARARRAEALAALALAGWPSGRVHELGVPDQQAAHRMLSLVHLLRDRLAALAPKVVLTHPYEGGHPDHDATAFAVHAARGLLGRRGVSFAILEMTSYHARGEGAAYAEFLPDVATPEVTLALSPEERARKRRMFDCFASQRDVLRWFPIEVERFRRAPEYDFRSAPHAGRLYYERFDWGITGAQWREHATAALDALSAACGDCAS